MTNLPAPEGPEYTRCSGCGHIEPEHRPDAGPCLVCACQAYRPAASAAPVAAPPTGKAADDLADRLEAVLTEKFTELGNPFSRMSINFQGPDGWPASREVGPHDVALVLRELLAVLPPPADGAAVLREAADWFDSGGRSVQLLVGHQAARELRRMADEAQQQPETETQAQPPRHRWSVETRDPGSDEWAPGTPITDRDKAVERYEHVTRNWPTWKDDTPVQRRLVRTTTTYTVEPAVVSQPGKEA